MIERWLTSIRDHPTRPSTAQVAALTMLALRMDYRKGTGFAAMRDVATDAGVSQSTVKRAFRWGRATGYLVCTKRGIRARDGSLRASEWRMTLPKSAGVIRDPSRNSAGVRDPGLQGSPGKHIKSPIHQESARASAPASGARSRSRQPDPVAIDARPALATETQQRGEDVPHELSQPNGDRDDGAPLAPVVPLRRPWSLDPECGHGMPGGRDLLPDGGYRCPLCRRGLPAGDEYVPAGHASGF